MASNKAIDDLMEHTETSDELPSDVTKKDITNTTMKNNKNGRLIIKPPLHRYQKSDDNKSSDENSFDTLILRNFDPFSSVKNVIDWLDLTDDKFNVFQILHKLRYVAIPLLVKGNAKRIYLLNRDKIHIVSFERT